MNDITVIDERASQDSMLLKVIESGNIESVERFIALREREESRHAAIEFDAHFSAMQAEFLPVTRDKKGYGYQYAPIESLQKQYGPIIAKHGFSYAWTEEPVENGIRCTMTIYGHGASRSNSMVVPSIGTNKQMNAAQSAGALSTYARRYTFVAGLGVVLDDEDNDAQQEPVDATQDVQILNGCKDLKELMTAWTAMYPRVKGDNRLVAILSEVKDAKKAELS